MHINYFSRYVLLAMVLILQIPSLALAQAQAKKQFLIVGLDEKQTYSDKGVGIVGPPGNDSVLIIDIGTAPLEPKIIASLPLANTISGPPVNLAINTKETLALVANSMNVVEVDGKWKQTPDNRLFVIDLETNPPSLIDTITVGSQPSGLSINQAGNLALIANRAENSISVLRITGKKVELIDTVFIGEQVSHVVFRPDGRSALASKFPGHKVAFLDVDGEKVTYKKYDVVVGLWPYNIAITPNGKLAITADNGNAGAADGNIDTVSIIDLEANPPRVINKVVVGDGPEGLAISPTGKLAVTALLKGSNASKEAFFYNRNAEVVALKIDGKKVSLSNSVEVRGLPEGIAFSNDGHYIYVGNFIDQDLSILRVDGDKIVNTGKSLSLPGHPASIRSHFQ